MSRSLFAYKQQVLLVCPVDIMISKRSVVWAVAIAGYAALCAGADNVNDNNNNGDSRIVYTSQGPVEGYKDKVEDVFTFLGVPYATAPTGENRYKAPLPAPTWLTPFKANKDDIICPQLPYTQMENIFASKLITEDCLIANIFVPNTSENNIPVVVYVHGGAFQLGFGNLLTPKKLVKDQKVIVVTFNYRVGIHGFLCLGTEDVPGNAGMKDQVALLRWVKKNIASFGGNPDDVTLAGYSAGSASVDLLMLSPSTKGLFTKVIPESGGSLAAFSMQSEPVEIAKIFARSRNISDVDDIPVLEEFYKTAPLEIISSDLFMDRKDSTFLFSPCVERDLGQEMFLSDSPYNILKSGKYEKVPVLYGFADMEGLLRIDFFPIWKEAMNTKFSDFLPPDLKFPSDNEKDAVANKIKTFYFGDNEVSEENVLAYVDFFSDIIFTYPMMKALKLHVNAGHNKVFLYEYSYVDEDTPVVPHTNIRGANHCAQTTAVLDGIMFIVSDEDKLSDDYKTMKATIRQLWGNFIRNGVPVPSGSQFPPWPAAGADGAPHMSIARALQLREAYQPARMQLWDDIYDKYYVAPQPPQFDRSRRNDEL